MHCGPVHEERNYVTDPLVIVEVLSPSTMDRDRGRKLRFHQTRLPTLCHIVLIYQDQMRVEHYRRSEPGWSLAVLTASNHTLALDAVGFWIDLQAIYEGVTFAGGKGAARDL